MDPRLEARIVADTYFDVNKMVGLKLEDPAAVRGKGHTQHQIDNAPEGAFFVWCNERPEYARDLARFRGREDLKVRVASWLKGHTWRYSNDPVVVDHAYDQVW